LLCALSEGALFNRLGRFASSWRARAHPFGLGCGAALALSIRFGLGLRLQVAHR